MRSVPPTFRLTVGVGVVSLASLVLAGCQSGTSNTAAPGASTSSTPTASATGTATPTASGEATPTASGTAGPTASGEASATPAPSTAGPTDPAGTPASTVSPAPSDSATAPAELPRGGTELFPRYRLVGYSGGAAEAFGRLGIGSLTARVTEIEKLGRQYDTDGREPLPVLELISTVVQASPGKDGMHRARTNDAEIARYLKAARAGKGLLLLNIQPGRADFLTEVKALSRWLEEPDVGLALDPEWAVGPRQKPGSVYGRTSAGELNEVSLWLSKFVAERNLPEKALVVHQLAPQIISKVPGLKPRADLQIVISVDGIGSRKAKEETWRRLVKPLPDGVSTGFKLFFEEDRKHGKLMTPAQVLKLRPRPEYVLYE